MKREIKVVHEEDIIPTIFSGRESARLITKERENSEMVSLHIVSVPAPSMGGEVCYPENDELLYFIEGEGKLIWEDKFHDCRPGTAVYIPKGCKYRMFIKKDSKILCVLAPPRLRSEWAKRDNLILLEPENAVKEK